MTRSRGRVGMVGCGAIGHVIARAFREGKLPGRLVAVCDARPEAARELARLLRPQPRIVSLDGVFRAADVVVECAGATAVPAAVAGAVRRRRDLLVMSVSGLVTHPKLAERARRAGVRIAIPSGALAGLDALRAAAVDRLDRVTLVTRKHPRSLAGAPFFKGSDAWLLRLKRPRTVFTGSAHEAVKGFPANVNVAAAASLAGLGPRRTRVTIVADPALAVNVHELQIEGAFGRAVCRVENRPSPDNPKTSRLAALSAVAALKRLLW